MKDSTKAGLKKLLILLLNFILFYALLRIIIALSMNTAQVWIYYLGTGIYAAACIGIFIYFFILNGYTFDNRDREYEELPAKWSEEKKADFMKKQPERRAKARRLMFVLMPLVVSILISFIELNFFG